MGEILGLFTAIGVMVTGAPIHCEQQVKAKVEALLLQDEKGYRSASVRLFSRETAPFAYDLSYLIHRADGSEKRHEYHAESDATCKHVHAKKL